MKRTRHSPEQIIAKLREADALLGGGATLGQVCQKLGVAEATFHRWRNQYGGAARPSSLETNRTSAPTLDSATGRPSRAG